MCRGVYFYVEGGKWKKNIQKTSAEPSLAAVSGTQIFKIEKNNSKRILPG